MQEFGLSLKPRTNSSTDALQWASFDISQEVFRVALHPSISSPTSWPSSPISPSCSLLGRLYRSNTLKRYFTAFGVTEILLFFPDKIITVRQNDNSEQFCCLGVDEVGRSIVAAAKEIVVKQQVGEEKDVLGKVEQLHVQVAGLEQLIRQLVKKIKK